MISYHSLRERKLVQWALAYLAGAWALLQVADLIGERFGWPDVWVRALVIVLVFGFFAALVLAWYHGEQGRQRVSAIELLLLTAVLLLAGAAVGWVNKDDSSGALPGSTQNGSGPALEAASSEGHPIAVLPFVNLSSDPEQEYFSDGVTEELLNVLARFSDLRVSARTSSFAFKHTEASTDSIARALRVRYLVEGSVRRSGDFVRIAAQLISAETGFHLWSGSYDRELHDVLALQNEIATSIAEELQLELTEGPARDNAPSEYAPDPHAYRLYLQGRYAWNKRTREGLEQSLDFFSRATRLDADYAAAHAAIASAYSLLGSYGYIARGQADSLARRSLGVALALDPKSPDAHLVRAFLLVHDFEFEQAEEAYRRAIRLRPSFATARHWYATHLMAQGRFSEALLEIREAQELDPLAPVLATTEGVALQAEGGDVEAIDRLRAALELEPGFAWARFHLALGLTSLGQGPEAMEQIRRAIAAEPDNQRFLAGLAVVHAKTGNAVAAVEIVDSLKAIRQENRDAFAVALAHAAVGDLDGAFDELSTSRLVGDPVIYLRATPALRPLRSDSRFPRLLERWGLGVASKGEKTQS